MVQALHGSARESKAAACSLLQHVLLWQYLKHRSVMALLELALEHETQSAAGDGQLSARGAPRRSAFDTDTPDASGSFLTEVGVPLIKEAMELVLPPYSPPAPRLQYSFLFARIPAILSHGDENLCFTSPPDARR